MTPLHLELPGLFAMILLYILDKKKVKIVDTIEEETAPFGGGGKPTPPAV